MGVAGYGFAALLVFTVGYVAVQWSHIRKVAAGAAAGTLAGSIAWLLIGTSAAGISAARQC